MIAALILAAGESSRLKSPKQLVQVKQKTLIEQTVFSALGSACDNTFVVVGSNSEQIKNVIIHLEVEIVYNAKWNEGKASSIQAGIDTIASSNSDIEAVLIMTCDQPYVTSELLDQMIDRYHSCKKGIVGCAYAETVGVPAIISRSYFKNLMMLKADQGAKQIISNNMNDIELIPFPNGEVDIDTHEDLETFRTDSRN